MSEGSQARRRPSDPTPPGRQLVALLGAVLCLAAIVGLWGVLSLALDRDVLDHKDTGPLLGPAMVVASCITTWIYLRRGSGRLGARGLAARAAGAAASAWAAMLVVGAVGYAIAREDAVWVLLFAAHYALSPFVVGAALIAGLVVLLGTWLSAAGARE